MGNHGSFQTVLQTIARMIGDRYGIEVVFEGSTVYTDGRRIILPILGDDLTDDDKADLHALLDHQVGHIRFSDFAVLYQGSSKFHQDLLMMAEDARIEALMMEDLPGTRKSFRRLGERLRLMLQSRWNNLSMADRLVAGLRDAMLDRPMVNDPVVLRAVQVCSDELSALPSCGTTGEVKTLTDSIARRLQSLVQYEPPVVPDPDGSLVDSQGNPASIEEGQTKDAQPNDAQPNDAQPNDAQPKDGKPEDGEAQDGEAQDGESQDGEAQDGEAQDGEAQDGEAQDGEAQDGEAQDGEAQDGEAQDGDAQDGEAQDGEAQDGEAQDGDAQDGEAPSEAQAGGKVKGGEVPQEGSSGSSGIPTGEVQDPAESGVSSMGGGEILDLPMDVESMVRRRVEQVVKNAQAKAPVTAGPDHGATPLFPSSTRFDTIDDHTDVRDVTTYAKLKMRVLDILRPMQRTLERVLKAQEQAHWVSDRERGVLSTRHLAQLVASPGYRTPFKELRKNDTRDIAVSILVDLSGSFCAVCGHRECDFSQRAGGEKLILSRDAAVAMAEVLKGIDIPCEVLGFTSLRETRMPAGKASTHLRWAERTAFHVYKDFETPSLDGITAMEAGRQNPTGEAVLWAGERLSQQSASRKILLVLSNGVPTSTDQPYAVMERHLAYAQQQVKAAGIETIGVGVMDDQIARLFPQHVIIESTNDLAQSSLGKLGKIITENAQRGAMKQRSMSKPRRGAR